MTQANSRKRIPMKRMWRKLGKLGRENANAMSIVSGLVTTGIIGGEWNEGRKERKESGRRGTERDCKGLGGIHDMAVTQNKNNV